MNISSLLGSMAYSSLTAFSAISSLSHHIRAFLLEPGFKPVDLGVDPVLILSAF
jgi:hypothetical protein